MSKLTAICLCLDKRKEHWIELGRQAAEFGIEFIPNDVRDEVIEMYDNYEVKRDLNEVFNYLVKHRCRNLLDNLQDF